VTIPRPGEAWGDKIGGSLPAKLALHREPDSVGLLMPRQFQ